MDAAFSTALRASRERRHVCLGVRLRPLTVGHLFVLAEIGSPFPEKRELATVSDVVLATVVCSQNHRKARRMIYGITAPFWFWLLGLVHRGKPIAPEIEAFDRYLNEHCDRPEPEERLPSGEVTAPLCWRLLAMLRADFHISKEEAMGMPLSEVICLWATEADRRGVNKLASERQMEFRAWASQMEAERLATEGAV